MRAGIWHAQAQMVEDMTAQLHNKTTILLPIVMLRNYTCLSAGDAHKLLYYVCVKSIQTLNSLYFLKWSED